MNSEAKIEQSSAETDVKGRAGRLESLDRAQLQQHIHSLEQKLARQRARHSGLLLSDEQQQQLVELLDKRIEKQEQSNELRSLIDRASQLNQQSERIQQDIQGLNIVSENATNKCYEITYNAQFVIDQNQKLQKSLDEHLARSVSTTQQCEELRNDLVQSIERTGLVQQKMDSATDRSRSLNEKSSRVLEELSRCKLDMDEQLNSVQQIIEVSNSTNDVSVGLQQQLQTLSVKVCKSLEEGQQQREAGEVIMEACQRLSEEITKERQHTEQVLQGIEAKNKESDALNLRQSTLISAAEVAQKDNKSLNLELQSSLLRNQQHREELTVLTSECREIRDETEQTQRKHDATIKEAIEKLSVALAETRQEKAQVERALKEVFQGNQTAQELAKKMTLLISSGEEVQADNQSLNTRLADVLENSKRCQNDLEQLVEDCCDARDKTKLVLETSVQINEDSQSNIGRLNEYMDSMCETRDELNQLIETSRKTNDEAQESLEAMRTNVNNSSLIQKESMRLNKESVATTLDAKRTAEKLSEELESSFKLNQHYQGRLKAAEKKYKAAIEAEKKYLELHESSLKALQDNEALLEKARMTMQQYSDNTADYNNSVKEFQQTTVQSQKIILETQSSIKSLLSSNAVLASENRTLKAQIQHKEPIHPDNVWPDISESLDTVESPQPARANSLNAGL